MSRNGRARIWWYALGALLVVAVAFFAVRGCAFMPWNGSGEGIGVRVTVSRDFGGEVLKDVSVEVRDSSSAMQALQEVAVVETSYGGGFIDAVNGLVSGYEGGAESGEKKDWFFYVNGQMADVGAGEYLPREGDRLVFDYHCWEYAMFTPTLVGCFPEPFVNGYREPPESCAVVYAPAWEGEAQELERALGDAGAAACEPRELEEGWRPSEGEYAIVIGTVSELEAAPFFAEANGHASRLGMYAFFQDGDMVIVDARGDEARRLGSGAGLVEGVGPRLGDGESALVVTGTDPGGLRAALGLLLDGGGEGVRPILAVAALAGEGRIEVPAAREE
ncbi:MAG: DUF4430 domain-containing protein [Actinomycetota bacterium]|nr:DUF4430 domain-containing protein [Actinomycetota bacterium]